MSGEGMGDGLSEAGVPLRDGRTLRVDGQGVHVGDALYPLDQIQDARVVSPDPRTIGLRVATAGLVTLVPVRSEDAEAALNQLYLVRPSLRPAGYLGSSPYSYIPSPPNYPPPPVYGTPWAYPPPGYPPVYGAPMVGPGYPPPGASYLPTYGPPPSFPGYPLVPPVGGAPGSPVNEGGVGLWPQGIGEVIGTGFRLYFKRFGGFLALGLLAGIWPALLAGALQAGLLYAEGYNLLQGTLTQPSPLFNPADGTFNNVPIFQWMQHPTAQQIGMLVGGGVLWFVLTLLLSAWAVAAMSLGARDAIAGRPVRVGAALGGGLRRMWSVLGVQLIEVVLAFALSFAFTLIVFLVGTLLFSAAVLSSGSTSTNTGGSAAAAALASVCGFFVLIALFVVAFIYLTYRIYLAQFAAAADHLSPFTALGRSWSLTWRNWWRTFLPVFVVYIVIVIVAFVGSMVQYVSIIGGSLIAVPLVTALTQPLIAVVALTIYYDLRLRREGYPALALELGLPALQPPPPPPPMSPMSPMQPTGPAQPDHPAAG